jgi:hypothetical protein
VTHYFAPVVYLLCFLAASLCAIMLGRHFHRTRNGLLFWSTLCFSMLALNNLLLVLDLVFLPRLDLAILRGVISLSAILTLLFGFIWNGEGE